MTSSVRILRAAGLSDAQILRVVELEQEERAAHQREGNRIRQQRFRASRKNSNVISIGVTPVTRYIRDPPCPPPSPPPAPAPPARPPPLPPTTYPTPHPAPRPASRAHRCLTSLPTLARD